MRQSVSFIVAVSVLSVPLLTLSAPGCNVALPVRMLQQLTSGAAVIEQGPMGGTARRDR